MARSVNMGTARDVHDRQAQSLHSPAHADPWGTWEELLLASAVQRYGIANWALISTELQSRTKASFTFTPEACQAEYQAIKLRFGVDDTREESDGTLWFEELRRLRVAHLKRELKQYDNSIGSLENKIRRLQSEKGKSKSHKSLTLVHGASQPERAPSGACEHGSNIVLADSDLILATKHPNRADMVQLNVVEPPCLDLSQLKGGAESASELQELKHQKGGQHVRLLKVAKFKGVSDTKDGKTLGLSMMVEKNSTGEECNVEEIDLGSGICRQVFGHSGTKLDKQAACNVSGSDFEGGSGVRRNMLGCCSPRFQGDDGAVRLMAPRSLEALNMKEHGKDVVLPLKTVEVDGDTRSVLSLQADDNKLLMSGVMGVLATKQSPSSEWADSTDNKHQRVRAAKNVSQDPPTNKKLATTENTSRDSSTQTVKLEILSSDDAMSEPSIYKLKGGMQTLASKELDITSPQPAKPDSKVHSATTINSPPHEVWGESLEVVDIQTELSRKKDIFFTPEKMRVLVTEGSEEKVDVSLPFTPVESSVKSESIMTSNDNSDSMHASGKSSKEKIDSTEWHLLERLSGDSRGEKSEPGFLVDGNEESSPMSKRNKKEPKVAGRLIPLLDSLRTVSAHKCAHFFKHKDQSNWRYDLMIRVPMDLGMIRIKLEEGRYSGSLDFFRDLLLMVTNALVYYPKDSSESAAAFGLRECILKEMDFISETEILVKQEGPTFRKRDTGKAMQLSPGKARKVIGVQMSVSSTIDTPMKDLALKQCDGSANVGHHGHQSSSFRPGERATTGRVVTDKKDESSLDAKRSLDCNPYKLKGACASVASKKACESGKLVCTAEATTAPEERISKERLAKSLGNEEQSSTKARASKATAGAINKNVEHSSDKIASSTQEPLKRGVGRPPKHSQNQDSQRAKEAYNSPRKQVKR